MSKGIIRFVRDVICAPYSIPIGLINKEKPLDMCGITSKKELDIKEVSTSDPRCPEVHSCMCSPLNDF